VWQWLRRLLFGWQPPPEASAPEASAPEASAPSTEAAPNDAEEHTLEAAEPGPDSRSQATEDYLRREFPLAPPAPEVPATTVKELSDLVREHFEANRPDPASFPSLAARVIDLTEQPDLHLDSLAQVIAQDPAIAFRILKVANSTFYRRAKNVEDLRTALRLLGLNEVARIAVGMAGRALFDMEARSEYSALSQRWSTLYSDSMTMAFSASWLGTELRVGQPGRAFLGGMFHDIGKTVALRAISTMAVRGEIPMLPDPVIDQVVEDVHLDLGVSLHATWNLPEYLTTLCLRHHDPKVPEVPEFDDVHIVRAVSLLNLLRTGRADPSLPFDQLLQALHALRMGPGQTRDLCVKMNEMSEHVRATFGTG